MIAGIIKIISKIPTWAYIIVGLGIAVFLYGNYRGNKGEKTVQNKWNKSIERGKIELEKIKNKQNKVTTVVETKIEYRDRIITQKGQDRVQIQKVFVPVDSGMLSGGFRLYHDAAAANTLPDPTAIPDAAPTAVADVAATVNANYTKCHKAYAVVEAWQEWASGMCKTNKHGCPINGQ